MRIAAGIVLIIAAIINLIGGGLGVLGGGASTLVGVAAEKGGEVIEEAAKEGATAEETAAATEAATELKGAADAAKTVGSGLLIFGLFLIVVCVLQIIGAVFLFQVKHKIFIFIVAAVSIVAELVGLGFGKDFVWWNVIGIVGGILAFIAAMSIGKAAAAPPPAAPAAPPAAPQA